MWSTYKSYHFWLKFPRSSYHFKCGWIWVSGICSPCLAPLERKTCPLRCWRLWSWFLPVDQHIPIKQHFISWIKWKAAMCDILYVDMHAHIRQIFRLFTHTFIHYIKREKLSLSFRVTPRTDIGLVGDSGSDSPPRDKNRIYTCNNKSALTKVQYISTKLE